MDIFVKKQKVIVTSSLTDRNAELRAEALIFEGIAGKIQTN